VRQNDLLTPFDATEVSTEGGTSTLHFRAIVSMLAVLTIFALSAPAMAAVHAGDTLFVTVYDHPELTGPVTVDASGHISLPLAGSVDVRGLEADQIAARLQRRLADYLLKPAVEVQLRAQQASIYVSGGPGGSLKYEPGETLIGALGDLAPRFTTVAAAEATAPTAKSLADLRRSRVDLRQVGILRDGTALGPFDALALSSAGKAGPELQPGDTLTLVDKPIAVRVMGDVREPGPAYLSEDQPLSDALAEAGGPTLTAASSHIELQRDGTTQTLALGDAVFNQPAKNGDVVTIPAAPRVDVAWLVDKPGAVTLKTDFSLLSALYQAGGPTQWANLAQVQVMRSGTTTMYDVTKLIHGDTSQNPQLRDGDLVFVPEGHKVSANAVSSVFQGLLSAIFFLK
jgi:protein involved in polysaccharide export with SLBB domain